MKIVLATHNPHKRDELLQVLQTELGDIELLTLDDIGFVQEIEETGTTLEENALLKARVVRESILRSKISVLADDTGLEVAALGGAPGVFTARYAGQHASYADNCNKLLREMHDKTDRTANFVTVIAFIEESGMEHTFRGEVTGIITETARGFGGFGYDPVFLPIEDASGRTFAEMPTDEKHAISHRGRAVRKFVEFVETTRLSE